MEIIDTKKVNKANKEFVKELNEKFPGCNASYGYHHEKGRYVHGYDGEEGFQQKEQRTATLKVFGQRIVKEDNNYKKDFNVFKPKDITRYLQSQIKECGDSQRDYNGQRSEYYDQYQKQKEEFESLLDKVKQVYPNPISKEEAIDDFNKQAQSNPKVTISLGDDEFKHLRDDIDVVGAAIRSNDSDFRYASDEIKSNKEFALKILNYYPNTLQFMDTKLQDDPQVVLMAAQQSDYIIRQASPRIQQLCNGEDPKVVLPKIIESEKLHTELHKDLSKPKESSLEFARKLSQECKEHVQSKAQAIEQSKPKARMKI